MKKNLAASDHIRIQSFYSRKENQERPCFWQIVCQHFPAFGHQKCLVRNKCVMHYVWLQLHCQTLFIWWCEVTRVFQLTLLPPAELRRNHQSLSSFSARGVQMKSLIFLLTKLKLFAVFLCFFFIEHKVPLSEANQASNFFCCMHPGNDFINSYACGCT